MAKVIPITLAQVRQREADPQVDFLAQRRADIAQARLRKEQGKMNALLARAQDTEDVATKLHCLRKIAAMLSRAMKGVTPCEKGCSHCCHQPVMIPQAEADYIGQRIGVAPQPVSYHIQRNAAYDGTPCPFLENGKCSIYDERPFVCRTHYSVAPDEILCAIFPGESIKVPYFNVMPFIVAHAKVFGFAASTASADLREFFPNGRQGCK